MGANETWEFEAQIYVRSGGGGFKDKGKRSWDRGKRDGFGGGDWE